MCLNDEITSGSEVCRARVFLRRDVSLSNDLFQNGLSVVEPVKSALDLVVHLMIVVIIVSKLVVKCGQVVVPSFEGILQHLQVTTNSSCSTWDHSLKNVDRCCFKIHVETILIIIKQVEVGPQICLVRVVVGLERQVEPGLRIETEPLGDLEDVLTDGRSETCVLLEARLELGQSVLETRLLGLRACEKSKCCLKFHFLLKMDFDFTNSHQQFA